jgi:hypothetical protein
MTFNGTNTLNAQLTVGNTAGIVQLINGISGPGKILKNAAGTFIPVAASTIGDFELTAGFAFPGSLTVSGAALQTGGTLGGTLVSQGSFDFQGGTFAGRLVNGGTFTFTPPAFTAGNGVQNLSTIDLAPREKITSNGLGLDNQGVITLADATLDGNGPLVNGSLISISGQSTIGGTAGFTNTGVVALGSTLTLSNSAANTNAGNIDLPAGSQLKLTGGNLSNSGAIN